MDPTSSERTMNLLNLLKFNQPSPLPESSATRETGQESGSRAPSFNDPSSFFAQRPSSTSALNRTSGLSSPPPSASKPSATSPHESPQDLLLRLLNRSASTTSEILQKPGPTEPSPASPKISSDAAPAGRGETPIRTFGAADEAKSSPFEAPKQITKGSIFTYVNPFDELAASSPRNKTPKPAGRLGSTEPQIDILKRPNAEVNSFEIQTENVLKENKTPLSTAPAPESVSEALNEVAQKADEQVREAIAKAGGNGALPLPAVSSFSEAKIEVSKTATVDKSEPNQVTTLLSTPHSKQKADSAKEVINESAQEKIADSWESADAEDSPTKGEQESPVKVFNLPMRPFTSIDINDAPPSPHHIRQDIVMEISRLKKEFDQMDRTLATASTNFIVYAMAKGGGFRVIRQDNGAAKQVFKGNDNKIYNVSIGTPSSTSSKPNSEVVLGTGVNGSVYWVTIADPKSEAFEEERLEDYGFILPPMQSQEESNAGMQLKTRVKRSTKHPEFFAIGRGKNINVIWPSVAMSSQYIDPISRTVDTEKYLLEHSLKVHTNKAGKDFTFSADDSLIVSLDKSGRLKFWDIRDMTDPSNEKAAKSGSIDVKTPLMTLLTINSSTEKSWPTSVMFVDKDKPTVKGMALRYLLLGMKQNHTLQLWDIGLGRPVQELNFPHENESDAICSIGYHPKSGIITVGHPTRNSIYFIHLSAPRYNLPAMSQASYVKRLAAKDATLPKPESTAIMSGIRELSFSSRGQLRSLEVMNPANTTIETANQDESSVFELYAMHSKGVTCLNVKKQDLGLDADNKVLHPVDAQRTGIVTVRELNEIPTDNSSARANSVTNAPSQTPKSPPSLVVRPSPPKTSPLDSREVKPSTVDTVPVQTKELSQIGAITQPQSTERAALMPTSWAGVARRGSDSATQAAASKPTQKTSKDAKSTEVPASTSKPVPKVSNQSVIKSETQGSTTSTVNPNNSDLAKVFEQQLNQLYRRIEEDKRVQEAAGAAKQDAILRLVSSTLTDNVEKSLMRIVDSSIQQTVLPSVANSTTRKVSETVTQHLNLAIPREMKSTIPGTITRAMQDPEVLRIIADLVSDKIANHVEQTFGAILNKDIVPSFRTVAMNAAQSSVAEVERRVHEHLRQLDLQRQSDQAKIDRLTEMTREMNGLLRMMVDSQASMQNELMALKNQASRSPIVSRQLPGVPQEPRDPELEGINELMQAGKYQEATVQWLQSPRQATLFDLLFIRFNPTYLKSVSHLITLSISAALTSSLDTTASPQHLPERLAWLELIFTTIDPRDPDIVQVAPQIIDVITARLQAVYMQISEAEAGSPLLPRIGRVVRLVRDVGAAAR